MYEKFFTFYFNLFLKKYGRSEPPSLSSHLNGKGGGTSKETSFSKIRKLKILIFS